MVASAEEVKENCRVVNGANLFFKVTEEAEVVASEEVRRTWLVVDGC